MKSKWMFVVMLVLFSGSLFAGTLTASCENGVLSSDRSTPLRGDAFAGTGDLVQLIWAGANGAADPADPMGNATGDDVIIDSVAVGFGFPFNAHEGKFSKVFTDDRLTSGTVVFMRAWDASEITSESLSGDSELYQTLSDFDSHNFPQWSIDTKDTTPIELASFTAVSMEGAIKLEWITESESENLGFNIFRSNDRDDEGQRVNEQMIRGKINSQTRNTYSWEDSDIDENSIYYYTLYDISTNGERTAHGPIEAYAYAMPTEYSLDQNYPNPFNPTTNIQYSLKDQGNVKVQIYNIRGQMVRELVNQIQFAGQYTVVWDGRDFSGNTVPSGTYLYTLEINDYKETRKMLMMK